MSNDGNTNQDEGKAEPGESSSDSMEFDDNGFESESPADWGGDELEAAYLKALSALEASESEIPHPKEDVRSASHDGGEHHGGNRPASLRSIESLKSDAASPADEIKLVREPGKLESSANEPVTLTAAALPPTPRQIIEACLFVGGTPLTSKRLSGVLRGDFDSGFVDREIDALNRLYAAENRPYEIRLGDGGYVLSLRDEYERIRNKVYGLGPKEVRLSQEALEVLAVVAYHQPIKQARVEELGKPNCGSVLRQLVRRELIAVEREPGHPRDVSYKTTPRFLSLFGIRSLDELPRQEQVSYK